MADSGAPEWAARVDGLLREVRRQTSRDTGPDVQDVLNWLHRQTGAQLAVVVHDAGTVESATPDFPHGVLDRLTPLLARMSDGQLAAAATPAGPLHVRCEALGAHDARPVLVVVGRTEPTPDEVALTSHAGTLLALLRQAGNGDRAWLGYQDKAHQVRFAVLHALMAGDPMLARRMTTGAVPRLLEADRLRLHLLYCPPARGSGIAWAHQDTAGYHGPDLLMRCPVFKDHLICLIAEDADGTAPAGGHGRALRRLVRDNPRYALGISGAHPLGGTTAAYVQATHALAAARAAPGRVAHYHARTPLEGVLPRQGAVEWASELLRPLATAPRASADITGLSLRMSRSGVARLLDLSRNTVTAHLRRAERALGQDLTDVHSRATVHLALAISEAGPASLPDHHRAPPSLDGLLRSEPAAAWAQTVLRPLCDRHLRTLRVWIDTNTDAQRAAVRLGVSRNTVRAHLRAVEALLGLDLLTTGAGVHDVVYALRIAGARAPWAPCTPGAAD
ncbi:PucR family transcriptional regulator [Streptomyces sp. AJS327]|uniref:helix-turn-helix domain-containing protein n=1 Tax=Streptomyces sp. AJS327 TaxID=2545265 RepID=UPI0015DEFA12|nr:helix-turn-helix domain-containing protein [Streptomyces sp. AJS327]MBA0052244.1 PucR family transcriptional regulator [Streptomyces sp. AJS327]